jgi:hypothetical protein
MAMKGNFALKARAQTFKVRPPDVPCDKQWLLFDTVQQIPPSKLSQSVPIDFISHFQTQIPQTTSFDWKESSYGFNSLLG